MREQIRTMALVLLVLTVSVPAVADDAVDTGSSCVTALHEEATEAGPLPSRLASLLGAKGQRLLATCTACTNYAAIAASFTTQVTQAFCGVASSITVLNASAATKPLTDPYKPYPYFTQCNIFNAMARARLDLDTVSNEGLTLSQATWLINAQQGVHATCWHAGRTNGPAVPLGVPGCGVARSAEQFRHVAREALGRPQRYLLVNFWRATLSDDHQGGGHFSPLAAYNGRADDLLLMDVARYKYPPFWVDTDLLWQAMATTDTSSGRHRGFIVVEVEGSGKGE
ncbi:MAG: phytochelatin synthase family protein [Geminicoccaceae bacterium]